MGYSGIGVCGTRNPRAPRIASLNPNTGPAGTSVIITGVNFTGATAVRFGTAAGFHGR